MQGKIDVNEEKIECAILLTYARVHPNRQLGPQYDGVFLSANRQTEIEIWMDCLFQKMSTYCGRNNAMLIVSISWD